MIVLALDTSLTACSVAVFDSDAASTLARQSIVMDRGHAEALAPMVRDVVNQAGLGFGDLHRIAVTVGPGTFTGVRIGLAMARGLGLALRRPVIGINTLEAIACNAKAGTTHIAVINDARREENYFALFSADMETLRGPEIVTLEQALKILPSEPVRILGTAADHLIEMAGRADLYREKSSNLPDPSRLAKRAATRAAGEHPPGPLYLRMPDAKPQVTSLVKTNRKNLRKVAAHEASVLAAIHAECFERPWSGEDLAKLMALPTALTFLVFEEEEPAGFVLANAAAGEAEILTIGTIPRFRRKGHATTLIDALVAELACDKKTGSLFIEVAEGNRSAMALYLKMGFQPAGRRKSYYQLADGSKEDARIMRKDLTA